MTDSINELWTSVGAEQSVFLVDSNNKACALSTWATVVGESEQATIGFADPCGLATHAGWPLRNILAYVHARYKRFVCCHHE